MGWRPELAALLLLAAAGLKAEPLPLLAGIEVSGWAVAEADGTGQVVSRSAGAAELSAEGRSLRPFTAQTPVRIASISKVVVALAINRLADQGIVRLEDDVSRHLGWPLRHPDFPDTPVTIAMLLRHEGSLSDAGGYGGKLGERQRDTITRQSWSAARPGTRFDYSNRNSVLLGEVIEAATGQRFDQAVQTLVLKPLAVKACFNWSDCPPGHAEAGGVLYRKSADFGEHWQPDGPWVAQVDAERPSDGCPVQRLPGAACDLQRYRPGDNGGLFSPQGGLRISISELARMGAAVASNRGRFLHPLTHARLFTPRPTLPPGDGEETDARLMQFWSDGGLHCLSGSGEGNADQPRAPEPSPGCGHLGNAYGLFAMLLMDPERGAARAQAITGSAASPPSGARSRFNAIEEDLARIRP